MFQVFPPASPGSSTQCFMWPSYKSLSSCAGFTIHPRHSHLHLRLLFPLPLFLVSFSLLVFRRPSYGFLSPTGAALASSYVILCYTEMYWENSHQDTDTQVKSSSDFLQGPCPTSSPSSTWPYCRRATDGLLAQNGSAVDTKSLSRSRCLLPLDICPRDGAGWMGIGGEGRGCKRGGEGGC